MTSLRCFLLILALHGAQAVPQSKYVTPQTFGAKGDGVHDDRAAIQAALDSGEPVFFPKPAVEYRLASVGQRRFGDVQYVFELHSGATITAEHGAVLKIADGLLNSSKAPRGVGVFLGDAVSNLRLSGLTIDMNGEKNLVPAGAVRADFAFLCDNCTDSLIEGVTIKDSPGRNDIVFGGGHGARNLVRGNTIINGGTSIPGNVHQNDFSAIYVDSSDTAVERNTIRHDYFPFTNAGGIELHGVNNRAIGNHIEKSYPGIFVVCNQPIHVSQGPYLVANNTFDSVLVAIEVAGKGDIDHLTVRDNVARTIAFPEIPRIGSYFFLQPRQDNGLFSYSLVLRNAVFDENTLEDLDQQPTVPRTVFASISATDNVLFHSNHIYGISGPAFVVRGSPFETRDVQIKNNEISGFGRSTNPAGKWAIYVDMTGSSTVPPKKAYDLHGLRVINNSIRAVHNLKSFAFYFTWSPASSVSGIVVSGNLLYNVDQFSTGPQGGAVKPIN
jgi:hypothetical protein